MRIIYNTSSGEIRALGYNDIQPGEGESLGEYNGPDLENRSFYLFQNNQMVRKNQSVIDKIVSEESFNVDLMTTRIAEVIDDAREIALIPYLGGIQSAAKAKNWAKLKALVNGLGAAQIATAQEVTDITAVIAEQGIVLGDY